MLFVVVDVAKPNLILFFLQKLIISKTPGLGFNLFFLNNH